MFDAVSICDLTVLNLSPNVGSTVIYMLIMNAPQPETLILEIVGWFRVTRIADLPIQLPADRGHEPLGVQSNIMTRWRLLGRCS